MTVTMGSVILHVPVACAKSHGALDAAEL